MGGWIRDRFYLDLSEFVRIVDLVVPKSNSLMYSIISVNKDEEWKSIDGWNCKSMSQAECIMHRKKFSKEVSKNNWKIE